MDWDLEERILIDEELSRTRSATVSLRGSVLVGLVAAAVLSTPAWFMDRPASDPLPPIDVSQAQAALAEIGSPLGGAAVGTETVHQDCRSCATVARVFAVAPGSTLGQVVRELESGTRAHGGPAGSIGDGLQCDSRTESTGAGADVGACVALLSSPGAAVEVDLGIQLAAPGYPETSRPWTAFSNLKVAGVVTFVNVVRPGGEE